MAQIQLPDGKVTTDIGATAPGVYTPGRWSYAAPASGLVNSTAAVTIVTASAGVRNVIHALQISTDALGAATEFAIRDGAGGTVLWRMKLTTAGLSQQASHYFPVPLQGTAGNLLEIVTLTASITGAVYFNAQGGTLL